MVAFLKASPQEKTYSGYLKVAREAEKEDSIDSSRNPPNHTAYVSTQPKGTSFFPLHKLKGNQPLAKMPAVHLTHLDEGENGDEEVGSDDPDGLEGITKEFMIHLPGP